VGPWVFETAVGRCGIWCGVRGITRVQLPEVPPSVGDVEPPPEVAHAIDGITALLRGEPVDLLDVVLDMDGVPEFHRRVYELTRQILPGETKTYGELAMALGEPGAARAVGQALGRNPFPIVVPCHRVLAAGGKSGGFSAPGGVTTKMRQLEIEGASAGALLPFD
jgi:methylated-DNA-[protein]-cysteine S-methyltransferase